MAFEVPCLCYARQNHLKKRLVSIKPRLKNVLDEEFGRQFLQKKLRQDTKEHMKINDRIQDLTVDEHVEVVIHGDTEAKGTVSPSSLVCQNESSVRFIKPPKMKNVVHIVVIEMNSDDEQKFRSDLKSRLSEIPELERKYIVVVAILPSKQSLWKKARNIAMKQCKFLENQDSNFECEKCVVILNSLDQGANRVVTRQSVRASDVSPSHSPRRLDNENQAPSPPKRQFISEPSTSLKTLSPPPSPSKTNSPSGKISAGDVDKHAIAKAIAHQFECKVIDIVESIETFLRGLKKRRDDAAGHELFTDLDKMLYELKGLYNISETKIGRERRKQETSSKLSKELACDLLKLELVKGCGRIYGKLDVHVEAEVDPAQKNAVKIEIEKTLKNHNYNHDYDVHFMETRLNQDHQITLRPW